MIVHLLCVYFALHIWTPDSLCCKDDASPRAILAAWIGFSFSKACTSMLAIHCAARQERRGVSNLTGHPLQHGACYSILTGHRGECVDANAGICCLPTRRCCGIRDKRSHVQADSAANRKVVRCFNLRPQLLPLSSSGPKLCWACQAAIRETIDLPRAVPGI